MQVAAELGYDRKHAKADYYAYQGLLMTGTHTWILPAGQFVINALSLELDDYDDPDFAISARTRRDKQFRYRLTYGAPVSLMLRPEWVPDWTTRDLHLTASFEQFRSLSNIANYTYANSKFGVMLNKRVEF
jgi:hypothetical protein